MSYIKLWALTQAGRAVARNTNNPNTVAYRIVHYMDQMRRAMTPDQISSGLGIDQGTVNIQLGGLSRATPPLVGVVA